jgi:hypothetical protein
MFLNWEDPTGAGSGEMNGGKRKNRNCTVQYTVSRNPTAAQRTVYGTVPTLPLPAVYFLRSGIFPNLLNLKTSGPVGGGCYYLFFLLAKINA